MVWNRVYLFKSSLDFLLCLCLFLHYDGCCDFPVFAFTDSMHFIYQCLRFVILPLNNRSCFSNHIPFTVLYRPLVAIKTLAPEHRGNNWDVGGVEEKRVRGKWCNYYLIKINKLRDHRRWVLERSILSWGTTKKEQSQSTWRVDSLQERKLVGSLCLGLLRLYRTKEGRGKRPSQPSVISDGWLTVDPVVNW